MFNSNPDSQWRTGNAHFQRFSENVIFLLAIIVKYTVISALVWNIMNSNIKRRLILLNDAGVLKNRKQEFKFGFMSKRTPEWKE